MVKPSENGSQSIAPFLKKSYEMVDDEATDSVISWSQNSDSFIIWDMTEFSIHLLPKYFKHSNFSSFIRQLNIYGFRKIDTDRWEFANDGFVRGQKDLLKNIARRKYSQGSEQRKSLQQQPPQQQENFVGSCENNENVGLWKEVENLKTDKNALMQELVKLRQHQETADNKMLLLKDRLHGMEKSQQQLLSFLVMAMQSPGFLVQLIQPNENNWRMAEASNMLEQVPEDGESVPFDHLIVRYQPPIDGTSKPVLTPMVDSENPHESDNSSDATKDFWMNIDFVKVLMDESHIPFIPPDLQDDGAWEKLLLANTFVENNDDGNLDKEGPVNSGMEMEVTGSGTHLEKSRNFELLIQNMGKSQNLEIQPLVNGSQLENYQDFELLTEQMGHLTSKSTKLQGTP
ncbi:heat stress transcription factor A-8 [Herrania umbratica]|uniref:Heat stress transcription factor A-8 n=1 Tax=Herrania umbratica TaxID=108875 RepID=A0A6J1B495_9ROSI|nr:heat stress transcription factor A-8 [Herrania umbratica]